MKHNITLQKQNVLSTNLWNKTKATFGNIEYNSIEICTTVKCFACNILYPLTESESLLLSVCCPDSIYNTAN